MNKVFIDFHRTLAAPISVYPNAKVEEDCLLINSDGAEVVGKVVSFDEEGDGRIVFYVNASKYEEAVAYSRSQD